jgi:hypothetical protein
MLSFSFAFLLAGSGIYAIGLGLPLGRIWIVSVAISLANLTLLIVDQDFALLVDGDTTCVLDGFSLGLELLGDLFVASASYCPGVAVRNDMLVFTFHDQYLYVTMVKDGGLKPPSCLGYCFTKKQKGRPSLRRTSLPLRQCLKVIQNTAL